MNNYPFYYTEDSVSQDMLFCEELPIEDIARSLATPLFLYSKRRLLQNIGLFKTATKNADYSWRLSYALKANSNPELLKIIAEQGFGASVVSGGELRAALDAGFPVNQITFDGPGKTDDEIRLAISSNIKAIVVESAQELDVISEQAKSLGVVVPVYIRVNPHVDAKTHPYISTGLLENKFGIDITEVPDLIKEHNSDSLNIIGIHTHIGSQITELGPFIAAAESILNLIKTLDTLFSIKIKYLDLGGGRGIQYHNVISHASIPDVQNQKETEIPSHDEFLQTITSVFRNIEIELCVEPGRAIIADTCVLVTKVLYTKSNSRRTFVIVDAAMNDLIRPSLYGAYHQIIPLAVSHKNITLQPTSVVGPICETGDFFAHDRELPILKRGDFIAILCTGAYGFSLSSNYNLRPKSTEVLVDIDQFQIIRQRQTIEEIL